MSLLPAGVLLPEDILNATWFQVFAGFVARGPQAITASPGPQSCRGYADLAGNGCNRQELFHAPMVA